MSTRRKSTGGNAARAPVVLVFGEDENDRQALMALAAGLRPDLARRIEPRRLPILLVKGVSELKARKREALFFKAIQAEAKVRGVLAAIVHEDCDAREPAHVALSDQILRRYLTTGCRVVPATPAWEMETWWFLWPEAAQALVPSWRKPDKYLGKNVGLIPNAKEVYRKATSPSGSRASNRVYRESDSPLLAAKVVQMGLLHKPKALSASYSDFVMRMKSV